ncbi:hypothetical protein [Streptomyces sp. NPDC002221]|uniref:hypothetical protein n=1 Tax=Streptomyces sp. NPDC002221 TaxID=3364639 RepID=UPI0036803DD7
MRSNRLRRSLTVLLAATGLVAALATAGPAQAAPAARAKFYLTTSVTHWYQNNGHISGSWLRTDDDTGHNNVYVSMANLSDADFYRAPDVVPHC